LNGVSGNCQISQLYSTRLHRVSAHQDEVSSEQGTAEFWLEELPVKRLLSAEETYCEEFFRVAHQRDGFGRYTVRPPAKKEILSDLGESRNGAMRMFLNAEEKLGATWL